MSSIRRRARMISGLLAGLTLSAVAIAGAGAGADTWVLQPESQLVGDIGVVAARHEDTLTDIGRVHGLGYEEIVWANPGVDIW